MAPDLNGITKGGKWDYSTPGSSGYDIPNITMGDPNNRRIKVITIGGGFSGILMAYQIQKLCQNVEHRIYEKNEDIGGTWLENRYPGCACDVPSHAYTMNFALNPDWPRFFSYSPDIWAYLDKICKVFDLRKYMTFNTEVVEAKWHDDVGKWKVKLRQSQHAGGEAREFEDECDVLLYATGILNDFKWPKIEGIEKFRGRLCHTARWPKDYQEEQWKEDRVAVIGSGASSIQTVPKMQPHVKHMDVFIRTGVWFVQIANNYGQNHEYSTEEKEKFRTQPEELVKHAKSIENQINGLWGTFYTGSEAQKKAQELFRARMAEFIKDERLLKGFTPKWEVGCRRVTPGDPYMEAIQQPNVDVHFTPVEKITEDGVIGGDGIERKCDTIVCATGFDVTYKPRFPVIGKDGVNLYEKWRNEPEAYLGLGVPSFPNFMIFIGPTWPVENGSVAGPLLNVSTYAIQMINKLQYENIKSVTPKQDITDAFNEHAQEWIKHTVWKDSCRSWYKNNDTGRVNAIWPGSSLHYAELIEKPRWEDYEIAYNYKNPWAFMGMGANVANATEGSDYSPYLQLENIDTKWLAAVQGKGEEEYAESVGERTSKRRRKDSKTDVLE
ncbi:FAD/NAD(P)-binding domain-containing protein [Rhizodiscina lignyota]|uniref:FAD/NAD(P)-binding domain-containing protein n=1 Tax=Rhizodiscina lignyota TaxID=1504668 RepID=A0A9P4LZE9_9PEZI|nr:FAD/NAD(P)-binding domain-containing protein [Rhizodiscina lignyota]